MTKVMSNLDSLAYDIGIEQQGGLLRVQVKSRSARNGTRYFCQFRRNYLSQHPHTIDNVDISPPHCCPGKLPQ
jgi:hypothetical protein